MARPLTLVLLGDIMLGRLVDDSFTCDASRKTAAFGNVLPYLHSLDPASTIIAGNLECAITGHNQPTPKAFNFKLSPSNADVLQQLHLNFVATANNHVLDYGQPGLKETNEVLDHLGIQHSGSGTQPTAAHPAVVDTPCGHRVAFLSYSDHYADWAATETTPGINFINPEGYDERQLQQQVAAARAAGPDLVVVMIHWGPNWRWQPDVHLRQLGRAFLAAGADIVFGTSPHHIQGVEVIGQKALIYSGGSFIDDYAGDGHYRNDLSAIMVARFAAAGDTAAAAAAADVDRCTDQSRRQQSVRPAADVPAEPWLNPQKAATAAASSPAADMKDAACNQPVPAAAAAAAAGGGSGEDSPALVLQELRALPIAITHHWRSTGAPFQAHDGLGNPAYFSQVDFAEGDNWQWVASKLMQLSQALGNSAVVLLPKQRSIRLFGTG
jgi:poly-gamma-glutamate synthesis protein (capsule biosynthesis protein)